MQGNCGGNAKIIKGCGRFLIPAGIEEDSPGSRIPRMRETNTRRIASMHGFDPGSGSQKTWISRAPPAGLARLSGCESWRCSNPGWSSLTLLYPGLSSVILTGSRFPSFLEISLWPVEQGVGDEGDGGAEHEPGEEMEVGRAMEPGLAARECAAVEGGSAR